MKRSLVVSACVVLATTLRADPRVPLPDTTWDAGAFSAESLGRGRTIAANLPSPASGSENPASLNDARHNVSYATTLVGVSSDALPDDVRAVDPLRNRVLQYFSLGGEKGVIFYEPLARFTGRNTFDDTPARVQDVRYQANAIGVAGAEVMGKGSFGLSFAYLWSALDVRDREPGQPDLDHFDNSNGVRLNFGIRQPTGPLMWGMVLQNMPAFLWGGSYKRQMLPPTVRVGNTWRAYPGILFSVDWERRFYSEGRRPENRVYAGSEVFAGERYVLRAGAFGSNLGKSEERHLTGGIGIRPKDGLEVSYAYESYRLLDKTVRRSFVSLKYPFGSSLTEETTQR